MFRRVNLVAGIFAAAFAALAWVPEASAWGCGCGGCYSPCAVAVYQPVVTVPTCGCATYAIGCGGCGGGGYAAYGGFENEVYGPGVYGGGWRGRYGGHRYGAGFGHRGVHRFAGGWRGRR